MRHIGTVTLKTVVGKDGADVSIEVNLASKRQIAGTCEKEPERRCVSKVNHAVRVQDAILLFYITLGHSGLNITMSRACTSSSLETIE